MLTRALSLANTCFFKSLFSLNYNSLFYFNPFALFSLAFSQGPINTARTCKTHRQWEFCFILVKCDSPVKAEVFSHNPHASFVSGHFSCNPCSCYSQRESGLKEQSSLKTHTPPTWLLGSARNCQESRPTLGLDFFMPILWG